MNIPDSPFFEDVLAQPKALRGMLQRYCGSDAGRLSEFRRLAAGKWLAFIGMGSSLYAPYGASLWTAAGGGYAVYQDASELLHYGPEALPDSCLPVLVSQSGESVELVRLAERWRGDRFAAVTNDEHSSLGAAAAAPCCSVRERRTPLLPKLT